MIVERPLIGDGITLRSLSRGDVTARYLSWLSDPEINAFLEVRHNPPHSLGELQAFVHALNHANDQLLLGIFRDSDGLHIGNIKLGPIIWHHSRAEVGIVIGERNAWGKGYATAAIAAVSKHALEQLRLRRLTAGCYEANTGSLKAFEKAGFVLEAVLPNFWTDAGGQRTGELLLGLELGNRDVAFWSAGAVDGICFIGGGDLMVDCMLQARRMGFEVAALLSVRHVEEALPSSGTSLRAVLTSKGLPFETLSTPSDVTPSKVLPNSERVLGVGFGPAWILPKESLRSFSAGLVNFNGIPIPHYLGGAHHTWQILNQHRLGGNYIQEMTDNVDRGDILMANEYAIPEFARTPCDYFDAGRSAGLRFLVRFFEQVRDQHAFERKSFAQVDANRLFFPRLSTLSDGWIDWSWTADEIARFCDAFAVPYPGASTAYRASRLHLHGVRVADIDGSSSLHPYCAGLIVRSTPVEVLVAARGGYLVVDDWSVDGVRVHLKEGFRLSSERLLPGSKGSR